MYFGLPYYQHVKYLIMSCIIWLSRIHWFTSQVFTLSFDPPVCWGGTRGISLPVSCGVKWLCHWFTLVRWSDIYVSHLNQRLRDVNDPRLELRIKSYMWFSNLVLKMSDRTFLSRKEWKNMTVKIFENLN